VDAGLDVLIGAFGGLVGFGVDAPFGLTGFGLGTPVKTPGVYFKSEGLSSFEFEFPPDEAPFCP
jgi:hypothetical protein